MKIHQSKYIPEMILAFYFSMFSVLRPYTVAHPDQSKISLTIIVLGLMMIYLMDNAFFHRKFRLELLLKIILLPLTFFLFDFLIRYNSKIGEDLYLYLLYGIIPIIFFVQINDYEKLLKYVSIIAFAVGVLYLIDPFNGYRWSGDYMYLGYNVMLPALSGALILLYKYKKRFVFPFIIAIVLEIFIYTNKGAALTAITVLAILYILFSNRSDAVLKRILMILFILIIALIFREKLFLLMLSLANKLGVSSYSLQSAKMLLRQNNFFDSRTEIWNVALEYIEKNVLFGYGIGYFQASTGGYVHNLFLDIALSSGVIVLILFVFMLICSIKKIIFMKDIQKRQIIIFFMLLWLVPLQMSLTLWSVMPFWLFWAAVIKKEYVYG